MNNSHIIAYYRMLEWRWFAAKGYTTQSMLEWVYA
jgi:hypothetical protein